MRIGIAALACILSMLSFIGCNEPDPVVQPDPVPTEDFILEVSEVTSVSCHFSVTPADKDMTYVVMLVEKADFDGFENEYEYQDNDLDWFNNKAMEEGKTRVSLETVDASHPFYPLEGSNNIILLTTERYHDYPMMIRGYGAGAGVTAAGVFANIMQVSH